MSNISYISDFFDKKKYSIARIVCRKCGRYWEKKCNKIDVRAYCDSCEENSGLIDYFYDY